MNTDQASPNGVTNNRDNREVSSSSKLALLIAASAPLLSVIVCIGVYFTCVGRIIGIKTVYEPPPSILSYRACYVMGPSFPKQHHPLLLRLYRQMYEIDKKWVRPKWWTGRPQLTPAEQAALGVTQGVALK